MKKLMILAAMLAAVVNANAQESEEYLKHEIAVSYGVGSNSSWLGTMEDFAATSSSGSLYSFNNGSFFGPLALEYFYHINPVIGFGAVGSYARQTKDIFILHDKAGDASNSFVTVMPAVKFNWLRKKHFGMYSKFALGATFKSQKQDYSDPEVSDETKSNTYFAFQATGIGIEAGSPNVRGFAEFGLGEQGILLAGLRCKF